MQNSAKITGWALLLSGIIIIFWTLYSSFNIFTAKAQAPEFFQLSEKEATPATKGKDGQQDIQAQMEKMISEQLRGILPADTIPKFLNLIIWSMLSGILIFGGGQIANLGIKLIKKE